MRLPSICIQRPVLTLVISLVLLVAGLVSFFRLELRFYPVVFEPTLTIEAYYSGASAEIIEQTITRPLEDALADIPDVDRMFSRSSQGYARVTLHFNSISQAQFVIDQSRVEEAVSTVSLPVGVPSPTISQKDVTDQAMVIGIVDPGKNIYELADYVKNVLQPRFSHLLGVGGVDLWGVESALRIELNPTRMAELGITAADVTNAIEGSNQSVPAGAIINQHQEIQVNMNSALPDIQSFEQLVVANKNGRLIHVSDIAHVKIGPDSLQEGYFYVNGKPGVALSLYKTSDGSPIAIGKAANQLIKQLEATLPVGMKMVVIYDSGVPLAHSIREVVFTIFQAVVLVGLITLLFLGNVRAMLIPTVTIPVCLVASFMVLFALNYSINIFTLLALVLAVGLVVDDAIVVLENVHRHAESGLAPLEAARRGSTEIAFAVIGMTVCLIAVYLPSLFASGRVGIYDREFAFTLAAAVGFSGLLALTLSPMMCSRLPATKTLGRYEQAVHHFFDRFRRLYTRLLGRILNLKKWVVLVFLALSALGGYFFHSLPSATLPRSVSDYVVMFLNTPDTASTRYTADQLLSIFKEIQKIPDYEVGMSGAGFPFGSNYTAFSWITMKPYSERQEKDIDVLADQVNRLVQANPAVNGAASAYNMNSSTNATSTGDIEFYIEGFLSYEDLNTLANQFVSDLKKDPGVRSAVSENAFDNQQYELSINRLLAAQLNVPLSEINTAVHTFLNGSTLISSYDVGGVSYPITVQLPVKRLGDFSVLDTIFVKSNTGAVYPLSRFVTPAPIVSLYYRFRDNQMRSMQLSVTPSPKVPLSDIMNTIQKLGDQILPSGVSIRFSGEAHKLQQGNQMQLLAFALGVVFIYLILAALFESFIDPLIVLLTVPLCIVGALFALKLVGGSLNMYTDIGLVTLIGLVSKHGVLITQFANELRAKGASLQEAVLQAAAIRLRPILMTTSTMVLGALPLLFATGADSAGRAQIGWVIIAGLLVGTLFSLFVVPVSYLLFARLKKSSA